MWPCTLPRPLLILYSRRIAARIEARAFTIAQHPYEAGPCIASESTLFESISPILLFKSSAPGILALDVEDDTPPPRVNRQLWLYLQACIKIGDDVREALNRDPEDDMLPTTRCLRGLVNVITELYAHTDASDGCVHTAIDTDIKVILYLIRERHLSDDSEIPTALSYKFRFSAKLKGRNDTAESLQTYRAPVR